MNKALRLMSASVLLLAVGMGTRAEASAIVFTDRDAFDLVAHPGPPLAITDVTVVNSGTIRVIYGDLLPVLYDFAGYFTGCSPDQFASTCTSITFGGGSAGSNYTSVGSFLAPVTAVGYEVLGTFTLFGEVVHTDTPQFLGFVFDAPTTTLPLPDYAYGPPVVGSPVPFQQTFSVQNIVISTPEPATLLLLGTAPAFFVRRRRRPRTGMADGPLKGR